MKILVLNGSPRKEASYTMRVTKKFLDGITQTVPAQVEIVNISECRIKPCLGCLSCWGRTEGECVIKDDDIPALKAKVLAADVIIESFPLYFFGMPGTMKVFTDRMLSMLCTYRGQSPIPGTSFHGIRNEAAVKGKKFLIISTCGYGQTDLIYDSLLQQYDCICGAGHYHALLCPQGKTMQVSARIERMLQKFTDAGVEFAQTGALTAETLAALRKPMFSQRTFQLLLDKFWEDEKAKGAAKNVNDGDSDENETPSEKNGHV